MSKKSDNETSDQQIKPARDSEADLKHGNRRVFQTEDLPQDRIDAIKNAKVDSQYSYLDDLLKDGAS